MINLQQNQHIKGILGGADVCALPTLSSQENSQRYLGLRVSVSLFFVSDFEVY